MEKVPDRIEKKTLLRAPKQRVWQALTDSARFGTWFGAEIDGPFVAGTRVKARIAPTKVDPEVAKQQEAYAGVAFELIIERIDPQRLFSFRWHPSGVDVKAGTAEELTTLVEFELEEAAEGTLLKVTESGFSKIPLERRAAQFTENEGGWAHQLKLIEKYLQAHA